MSETVEAELARLRDAVSRMERRLAEGQAVDFNDFAYRPRCRDWSRSPGAMALATRLEARDTAYRATFEAFVGHDARLRTVAVLPEGNEPCWENWWLPGLDAVALYGMVALHKPRVFLEVGSGHSTRFVRRSIADHGLATRIVSIDPNPTQEIDAICDEVVRRPLEEVDPAVFASLRGGDMLFVDNSHRSFQNSDVTVFFTEILPALAPGVIYALHDIFLPFDYPESWTNRFYNEQYLLMTYLLGGADGDEVLLPMHHVSRSPAFADLRNRLFLDTRHLDWLTGSFWMQRAASAAGDGAARQSKRRALQPATTASAAGGSASTPSNEICLPSQSASPNQLSSRERPMTQNIHFISGLPRSGSTLLAAILRQNPAVHAHITSPIGSMVGAMLADMSAGNETSVFIDDAQREAVLRGLFDNFYGVHHAGRTIFDTNRGWTGRIDLLAKLFPECKVICCVRHIPWIIDSVERLIRHNSFELSKIFGYDKGGTVYSRADGLMSADGLIGFPLNAMKQAMHGAQSGRLLLLPYDTLAAHPEAAMEAVYAFTGLAPFKHDFENISFDTAEFDARLGTPGLHDVRPQARHEARETILPPDLWRRWEGASIWRDSAFNKHQIAMSAAHTLS